MPIDRVGEGLHWRRPRLSVHGADRQGYSIIRWQDLAHQGQDGLGINGRFHYQTSSEDIDYCILAVSVLPPPPTVHFITGQHHLTLCSLLYGE